MRAAAEFSRAARAAGSANGVQSEVTAHPLILRRSTLAHAAIDDYEVLCQGRQIGRIYKDNNASGRQWFWDLEHRYHMDHTPTHGYEESREAAMAAFAKSWRRE